MISNYRIRTEQLHPVLRISLRKLATQLDRLMRYWRTQILRRPRPNDSWIADRGDDTLRVIYPLTPESVVLDIGGYKGTWSQKIHEKYQCHIHIFEPVSSYRSEIEGRFAECPKVTVYPFGLAGKNVKARIAIRGDASSVLLADMERDELIELHDVADVLQPMQKHGVDLVKINIEGGEYDLLSRMLETGITSMCRNIQVQFHPWVPHARERRKMIQEALSRTHSLTYEYPFVWENWLLSC